MTDEEHARVTGELRGRKRDIYQALAVKPKTQKELHAALGLGGSKVSLKDYLTPLQRDGLVRSRRKVKRGRTPASLWEVTPAAEVEEERQRARRKGVGATRTVGVADAAFGDLEKLRKLTNGSFTAWNQCQSRMVMLVELLRRIEPMIFWRAASDDLPETVETLIEMRDWIDHVLSLADKRTLDDGVRDKLAKLLALSEDPGATPGERESARLAYDRWSDRLAS